MNQVKSDGSKDRFYEELEQVFDHFSKFHIKILLYINSKLRRENIFKPTIRNDSLRKEVMIVVLE
jgi:hypothetical protein